MGASELVLGWRVTPGLEPCYWLSSGTKAGQQDETELCMAPADAMATHTAIIAQSGSGKSFFLGRLVEELLLRSRAKCIILDSNADFRLVHTVRDASLWQQATYDAGARRGRLPHEASRREFLTAWSQVKKTVLTAASPPYDLEEVESPFVDLRLWWPSLMAESLFEEVDDPMLRSQLYHCHAFCQAIGRLEVLKCAMTCVRAGAGVGFLEFYSPDPIDRAEELWLRWQSYGKTVSEDREERFRKDLEEEYKEVDLFKHLDDLTFDLAAALGLPWPFFFVRRDTKKKQIRESVKRTIRDWLRRASIALGYVTDNTGRFYFGKAREYVASGVLGTAPQFIPKDRRLMVVDLPSFRDRSTRLLVINAILNDVWVQARAAWMSVLDRPEMEDDRVPTFIVLDEAHNLVPSEPRGKAQIVLNEQFRTIAAEGRKYGIFLIMASQRPDRLDPFILSECENKALMRLDSEFVLDVTRKLLGLDDVPPRLLAKSLEAELGRVMLVGRWASGKPQWMYSAARRTIEGGRSLRPEHWAKPETNLAPVSPRKDVKRKRKR